MTISQSSSIIGQPWFLSVVSGLIAVFVFRMGGGNSSNNNEQQQTSNKVKMTKMYLSIFLTVAVLVYGSFMISFSYNGCKLMNNNIPIQTGGSAPF